MDHHERMARTHRPRGFLSMWGEHPGVRSGNQLTLGERAADAMRNGMGSWTFVLCALVFLAVWMSYNRNTGFDKYPFILLNLVLSCLAALQGAILLIAAKRSDQIASELAQSDYKTNVEAAGQIKKVHQQLIELHEANQELLERNSALLERLAAHLDGQGG